jgi:hypothetical protein
MAYEAPKITTVGSVANLTQAQGWNGWDDHFLFFPLPGDKNNGHS